MSFDKYTDCHKIKANRRNCKFDIYQKGNSAAKVYEI